MRQCYPLLTHGVSSVSAGGTTFCCWCAGILNFSLRAELQATLGWLEVKLDVQQRALVWAQCELLRFFEGQR